MSTKLLSTFLFAGIAFFVLGVVLTFVYGKIYAVGFTTVGVIWIFVSFGQMRRLMKK